MSGVNSAQYLVKIKCVSCRLEVKTYNNYLNIKSVMYMYASTVFITIDT